ncbi:serine hydrolase domain-containing protein [Pseudemcibacter aquimaris]|uniref:serine hydrolase domain-containing protein n=1 Tax=Pseudemcibacter aquimaris TaxID=2857064 RepID=UPI00201286A2|nr:serine hydrolase [Pseudemcibacter aquimaris]MCC3861703.1 serine hydrolase [Pseudemcibacter aquimaris]WDU58473.1 serine hydrolase [Pseudemcibacter aquimaris]
MLKKITFLFLIFMNLSYAQDTTQIDREMRETINQIVMSSDVPGISVAIAGPDGLIWSGTAGYSNIEERQNISQGHLFGIGDLSSDYIAATAVMLIKDGLLDENATPKDILGNIVNHIEYADRATVKQLIAQQSAIYSYDRDNDWQRRARGIQLNPKYRWEKGEALKYNASNLTISTSIPGSETAYSKTNATLLGLIIEKTSGGMLEDEIRNRILVPNNLKETYLDGYEIPPKEKRVGNYHLGTNQFISEVGINAKFQFIDDTILLDTSGTSLTAEGPAGSILATSRDLALFQASILNGELSDIKKYLPARDTFHSEILGFTTDVKILDTSGIVIVSNVNLGVANTGQNAAHDFLNTYMEKIILPVAKKYAK